MIAPVEPKFEPPGVQKQIKVVLERMTGLGVKIQPVVQPGETVSSSVVYMFKCQPRARDVGEGVDDERLQDLQANALHGLHGYIQTLLMTQLDNNYSDAHVAIVADPEDPKNGMWPCVRVKFGYSSGYAVPDEEALRRAEDLERRQQEYIRANTTPPTLEYHLQKIRNQFAEQGKPFDDAYADQLGRG